MISLDGQPLPPGKTIRVVAAVEKVVEARGTKRVVSRTRTRTAINRAAAAEEASDVDIWGKYTCLYVLGACFEMAEPRRRTRID